jgi:hypothetical protein
MRRNNIIQYTDPVWKDKQRMRLDRFVYVAGGSPKSIEHVTTRENKKTVLEYIHQHRVISLKKITELLNITMDQARFLLFKLERKGDIRFQYEDDGTVNAVPPVKSLLEGK